MQFDLQLFSLSHNAQQWEDLLRHFLDEKRAAGGESDDSNPLFRVWQACEHLGADPVAYFKQVCFVGCVRAGITRLDKNLVGVFDLRCVITCYSYCG